MGWLFRRKQTRIPDGAKALKAFNEFSCPPRDKPISSSEMKRLEDLLDGLFERLDIDIAFTKHFKERINDNRNGKQIGYCEVTAIFAEVYKKFGVKLSKTKREIEEIIKSISTNINIPVVIKYDDRRREVVIVAKTIMRKRDFKSSTSVLKVEDISMKIIPFKRFLNEGGNVVVSDIKGKEVPAQKIDLSKFKRKTFTKDLYDAFIALNKAFKKENGVPLWKDTSILKSGFAFNGSSETFFDPDIEDDEYKSVKPKVGDIDVTVPEEYRRELWELLKKLHGKNLTSKVVYTGDNRPSFSARNDQINSIFTYTLGKHSVPAQVDFEFTPYVNNNEEPSEYGKFGHSSDWRDMKSGLKGVHQKYILRSIAGGASTRDDIIVMTPTATPEKPRVKKLGALPRMLKFYVSKGVRTAYEKVNLKNGKDWVHQGKMVYKEIPTKSSSYEQNLENIFKLFFSDNPSKGEIKKLWSFMGILELMKRHHTDKQIERTFDRQMDLYWGKSGQGFERNNPELDFEIKQAAYNEFIKMFPKLKSKKKAVDKMVNDYYKAYRMTEIGL